VNDAAFELDEGNFVEFAPCAKQEISEPRNGGHRGEALI